MKSALRFVLAAMVLAIVAGHIGAQEPDGVSAALPDAPAVQQLLSDGPAQSNSGSQSNTQPKEQTALGESQREKAAEQLKEEEQQRVLGVMPTFGTTYHWDAVTLSPRQKMQLAFRSAIDPFTFAVAGLVAGMNEALDNDSAFGWGAEGFGKRMGAAYLDAFNGTMLGAGILPIVFHQDPRYFRMGHGSFRHRLFYAVASSYICRHDNTGKWEPNYSNVLGNITAGAISNLYYPSEDSGWSQTIGNGFIVTTEGTAGGVFDEFWPDISRKLFHNDPTHGLDARAAAAAKAEKQTQTNEK